jgi:hypothetical protein
MRQSSPLWYDVRTGRQVHAQNRGAAARALGAPLRAVQQAGYTAIPSRPAKRREQAKARQGRRSAAPTYLFVYLMLREHFPAERQGLATKPLRDFLGDMRGAMEKLTGVERRALQRFMDARVALWRARGRGEPAEELKREDHRARNNRPCRRAMDILGEAMDGALVEQERAVVKWIEDKLAAGWSEDDAQSIAEILSAVWIPRGWR